MTYLYFRDSGQNCWSVAQVSPCGQPEVLETYSHARQARRRAQDLRAALAAAEKARALQANPF